MGRRAPGRGVRGEDPSAARGEHPFCGPGPIAFCCPSARCARHARLGPHAVSVHLPAGLAAPARRQCRAARGEGFQNPVHAAAGWYSWMSPPSRSPRLISLWLGRGSLFVESGVSSASPRCGRSRL